MGKPIESARPWSPCVAPVPGGAAKYFPSMLQGTHMPYHGRANQPRAVPGRQGLSLWLVGLIAATFGPLHVGTFAQAPSSVPAGHVHYTEPPQQVSPTGAL